MQCRPEPAPQARNTTHETGDTGETGPSKSLHPTRTGQDPTQPTPSSPPPKTLSPRSPIDPALLFVAVTTYYFISYLSTGCPALPSSSSLSSSSSSSTKPPHHPFSLSTSNLHTHLHTLAICNPLHQLTFL